MAKTCNPADLEESLIDFPCDFPVKVVGAAIPELDTVISKIAHQHDSEFNDDETRRNVSKTGKYISLTLNIHAKNKAQLDALYDDLTSNELVLWVL